MVNGMVRRIDELGRIVIPKELRNSLKINSGDAMEIELDSGKQLVIKKLSSLQGMEEELFNIAKVINELTNATIIFANEEKVIISYGKRSELYLDKYINQSIYNKINNNLELYRNIHIINNFLEQQPTYICTIGNNNFSKGIMIIIENEKIITSNQQEIIINFKKFINKSLIN